MGPHHSRRHRPSSPTDTTRIHPKAVTQASFPRRAVDVEVITIGEERLGERIWIGGSAWGVEITRLLHFFALAAPEIRPSLFTALRALDGSRSIGELTSSLALPQSDFVRLLTYLEEEGLIHFHSERALRKSDSTPGSLHLTRESYRDISRREIEREHLPRGASFARRSEYSVVIVSEPGNIISPIASLLASLLFGSGVNYIKFFLPLPLTKSQMSHDEKISDRDLGLSIFHGSDIGVSKIEKLQELAHRSAILPLPDARSLTTTEFDTHPQKLIIALGYPRPDHHQRWLSEAQSFFLVPGYGQGQVRIGPFVIPGRTPCLRCFELNQVENDFWREQSRQLQLLQQRIDPPTIASHMIASLAAHYALQWIDGSDGSQGVPRHHPLLGVHKEFSLSSSQKLAEDPGRNLSFEGVDAVRTMRWQNHPECGCHWISTSRVTSRS